MATTKRVAKKAAKKTAAPAPRKTAKVKKTSAQPRKAPAKKPKLPGKATKSTAKVVTKQATKAPRRRSKPLIGKPAPVPSLDHTVNMGPERGDNSFPPSNKRAGKSSNRA